MNPYKIVKVPASILLIFIYLILQSGCDKTPLNPTNTSNSFTQNYGNGSKQVASDILRTDDGGYIMVGKEYVNATDQEGDIVAIKTDSLGVQEWKTTMGKAAGAGSGSLSGKNVKYDKKGSK